VATPEAERRPDPAPVVLLQVQGGMPALAQAAVLEVGELEGAGHQQHGAGDQPRPLSKSRTALRPAGIQGRGELRLELPPDPWIDVEAALEAVHRAESAVALGRWRESWGAALVARFVAARRFLPGYDAAWVDAWRRRLAEVLLRALEAYTAAALGVGGTELAAAERTALELIERAPFRESGYRLLMEVKAAHRNVAEALQTYQELRVALRKELGVAPGRRPSRSTCGCSSLPMSRIAATDRRRGPSQRSCSLVGGGGCRWPPRRT
jgi:transcriptional activator